MLWSYEYCWAWFHNSVGGIFSDLRAFFVPGSNPIGRGGLVAPPIRENASSRASWQEKACFHPVIQKLYNGPRVTQKWSWESRKLNRPWKRSSKKLKSLSFGFWPRGKALEKDSHRWAKKWISPRGPPSRLPEELGVEGKGLKTFFTCLNKPEDKPCGFFATSFLP